MFLIFNFIFSITMPPVQTFNPIGRKVPNPQFWVSFLLKDTRCFEKAKDCLFELFVSFFKFCFLENFILHFLHQFGAKFLCKLIFLSQIWGFNLCKESFRAPNCWDLQLCFIFLCIRIWFLKLPVFYTKQVVDDLFFWNVTIQTNPWVGSLHWKPSLMQFSSIMCRIVFSRNSSLVSKTCISITSFKVSASKISIARNSPKNNLSASAF